MKQIIPRSESLVLSAQKIEAIHQYYLDPQRYEAQGMTIPVMGCTWTRGSVARDNRRGVAVVSIDPVASAPVCALSEGLRNPDSRLDCAARDAPTGVAPEGEAPRSAVLRPRIRTFDQELDDENEYTTARTVVFYRSFDRKNCMMGDRGGQESVFLSRLSVTRAASGAQRASKRPRRP